MPSLRSQSRLNFPVQKNIRSRRGSCKVVEEVVENKDGPQSPGKRRTSRTSISQYEPTVECSPTKKTRTPRKAALLETMSSMKDSTSLKKGILSTSGSTTPSRAKKSVQFDSPRRQATIDNAENLSPTKLPAHYEPRHSTSSSLLAVPLSPRCNLHNVPGSVSPMKCYRLNNSPSPCCSPKIYANGLPSARALDFSPTQSSLLVLTPTKSKKTTSPRTPTQRVLNFSPAKEMRLGGSSARRNILLGMSPKKQLGGALMSSPRKISGSLVSSPKKFGNPLLSSPRKDLPPLSPRKLDVRSLTSPMRLAKQEGICYQRAKQALHTAIPDRIVCRDTEKNCIQGFLDRFIRRGGGGSLYISGAPGTGKTAVMSHMLQDLQEREECENVYINCMNAKNTQAILNKLQSELQQREVTMPTKDAVRQLEKAMCSKGKPIVLILDELDQLDSRNQDALYTMFEWPSLNNSRLVLIGIANALDLTDRILPRLLARPKCRPELLNFQPYTKKQIVEVLRDRLNQVSLEGHVVLDPTAVQFCARKVAAVTGDMRRALDVCRRAVENVEADVRKQPIITMMSLTAGFNSPSKPPPVPKKITVAHVMRTLNEVYGHSATRGSTPQTIPLQQKLTICSLLLMVKHGKAKEVTLGKLHDIYRKVCAKEQVASIAQSEFHSLCSLIEAKGICSMKKAKDTRMVKVRTFSFALQQCRPDALTDRLPMGKVTLKLDESELEQAMQDKVLMSSILADGLPK